MIKIDKTEVYGWEAAIRGMRNPMNSWEKSDSSYYNSGEDECWNIAAEIGPADHDLMIRLAKGGPVHAKYRRMIVVYTDILAPLYWWKEFDTYKVGTVANSCSTMHKIHAKEFTIEDFSHEHLLATDNFPVNDDGVYDCGLFFSDICPEEYTRGNIENNPLMNTFVWPEDILRMTIQMLNQIRELYIKTNDKRYWWQMIQLLPTSYNQKRTIMLNYEVLAGIYPMRKNHKLDEWHDFCRWIESLPYSEIIIGEKTILREGGNEAGASAT